MTTTITIYRLPSQTEKNFAHVATSETYSLNGVPTDADITFNAFMREATRETIKQFALSERPRQVKLPIEWDDTNERW